METLTDLTVLAEFEGTSVPAAPLSGPCLALFGPILTHPARVTFPWAPLRHALHTYFEVVPSTANALDPSKVSAGWCGLSLILTAFKRLEVVESESETAEVLSWLNAIKIAAIRRSLAYENTSSTIFQDVLRNLLEPVPAAELVVPQRSRSNSNASVLPSYAKLVASTSTSFERGGGDFHSGSSPVSIRKSSDIKHISGMTGSTGTGEAKKRGPGQDRDGSPNAKKRRSNSLSQINILGARPRDQSVSTSALSSFADLPEHHDLDPLDSSDEEEESYLSSRRIGAHSSSNAYAPANTQANSAANAAASYPNGAVPHKITVLAQRLSDVTGIPLERCIDTICKFPNEDLSAINPNAPIPPQFLPGSQTQNKSGRKSDIIVNGGHKISNANGTTKNRSNSTPNNKRSSSGGLGGEDPGLISEGGGSGGGGKATKTRTQRPHDPNRPNYSYSALIGQAILNAPNKRLRLAEIYEYVTSHYAYYKKNECGWQNSIRHNLSLQPVFKKVPDIAMPGKKGCFWTIIESEEWRFANGGWQKMEKGSGGHGSQTSSPVGSGAHGMAGQKGKSRMVNRKSIGGVSMNNGSASKKSAKPSVLQQYEEEDLEVYDDGDYDGEYDEANQTLDSTTMEGDGAGDESFNGGINTSKVELLSDVE